MKRFTSIVIAAIAVLVVSATLSAQPASAKSASLSIVPKKNYTIEPGKTANDTLTVRNLDAKEPLELTLRVVDFTFTNDGGAPQLMLKDDAPLTTWSLKPFLTLPETVTIPPKSSKTLDMSVSIPAGHGAGSYYSAIVYSSGAPGAGGNVGLNASGVTLVFTTIPGKVNEDLKLERFGAYNAATSDKEAGYVFVTTKEPEVMAYTLKNNGNVTESPVGSITIKNMFGQSRTISNVNPSESLALIGQSRTFTSCIKLKSEEVNFNGSKSESTSCTSPGLWPGYYSATLDLFYGQNGNRTQEIGGKASFLYLPAWFVFIVLILLLALVYVVWRIVRAVRGKLYGTQKKKSSRK